MKDKEQFLDYLEDIIDAMEKGEKFTHNMKFNCISEKSPCDSWGMRDIIHNNILKHLLACIYLFI